MYDYCSERFGAQRRLAKKIAPFMEVNEILEAIREELRALLPEAMEACVLLLDPDARQYTRPLQCALYDRPVNCLMCKRNRPAVQRAVRERKSIVVTRSGPVLRHDSSVVKVGPEAAVPVLLGDDVIAVLSVVVRPGSNFMRKDFLLLKDFAETLANVIVKARKHWEVTKEKLRISRMLANLTPFVPFSVRNMLEKDPDSISGEKKPMDVTVLFLDLEGYTALSHSHSESKVSAYVERLFSSFVDPIQRSRGDINETAGDGLMIIFKEDDAKTNAVNGVKAALEIQERALEPEPAKELGLEPVGVKMGINSGKALLGMTRFKGSLETRMTYTASGPVTIVAARLAALAKGGEILMGEETMRLLEGKWPVYDKGEVRLKGIDNPVRIFSLSRPLN
jgi:class 3 adenylate cyclase/putative methionine-R-sulfoxide reductase with GAF domain